MRAVMSWVVIVIVAVLVLWGMLHMFISPVNPAQKAPSGHVAAPCWSCHFVSESADLREVDTE